MLSKGTYGYYDSERDLNPRSQIVTLELNCPRKSVRFCNVIKYYFDVWFIKLQVSSNTRKITDDINSDRCVRSK